MKGLDNQDIDCENLNRGFKFGGLSLDFESKITLFSNRHLIFRKHK